MTDRSVTKQLCVIPSCSGERLEDSDYCYWHAQEFPEPPPPAGSDEALTSNLRLNGVSRAADDGEEFCKRVVELHFNREPTDDELRALHVYMRYFSDDGFAPETKPKWKCGADRSGIGGNMPQDCDWPYCGCDETATKVIEALQEQGWMPVPRSASMPDRVRPQEAPNKSKVEYIEELANYCGFVPRFALHNLPRSRELEALLEHLANAQDDALRLHHAYVDLKYPQSTPSAQETSRDHLHWCASRIGKGCNCHAEEIEKRLAEKASACACRCHSSSGPNEDACIYCGHSPVNGKGD